MDISRYFDYAAATPIDKRVVLEMLPFFTDEFYNPSALYLSAKDTRSKLEGARQTVAQTIGARPSEIIFTAGGTESDNLAIQGVMNAFPGKKLVVSAIEHDAVLRPASRYIHCTIPVTGQGLVLPDDIRSLIDDETVLVSLMLVNNEVGAVQPIREVAQLVDRIRRERKSRHNSLPLYLHSDACQAANILGLHVGRLGIDMLTLNGGKIYGPKQSGVLYRRAHVRMLPLIDGGGQEWGMRSGTENVAFAVGFSKALEMAQKTAKAESHRLIALRDKFIDRLHKELPMVLLNGPKGVHRSANNVHVTFPGYDNERLLMELDERGFQVAVGSACSASSDEPSHVLRAMGLSDQNARSSIRITLGSKTSDESLTDLERAIVKLVAKT